MKRSSVAATEVERFEDGSFQKKPDLLAVEEPLEIRLGHGKGADRKQKKVSVTMRTPGNDFELAVGFLFSEGIIPGMSVVDHIRYCINKESGEEEENIVRVELKEDFELKWESDRNFYTTSSCGVCGKASIESVETSASCSILENGVPQVEMDILRSLPKKLRSDQNVFEHTGGLHAVAAFNTNGELLMMREDVGRHNALDKLIGAAQIAEMDLSQCILLLSGRASFELIQKSVMAQIPVVAAIGAPSSLAVNLAQNFHMTLIGFLKKDRFNIYSDFGRIRKNAS